MVYSILVIGGNTGIGLAIVKKYLGEQDTKLYVTARRSTDDLVKLQTKYGAERLEILHLDISDKNSIDSFSSKIATLAAEGLDFFIGNSATGVGLLTNILDNSYENYLNAFQVNALGLIYVFQKIYPLLLLKQTRKVVFISSVLGSIGLQGPIASSSYGQSKLALNFAVVRLLIELKNENFTIVSVHPGAVGTDTAREYFNDSLPQEIKSQIKFLTTEECVDQLKANIFDKITVENSGEFISYEGDKLPY